MSNQPPADLPIPVSVPFEGDDELNLFLTRVRHSVRVMVSTGQGNREPLPQIVRHVREAMRLEEDAWSGRKLPPHAFATMRRHSVAWCVEFYQAGLLPARNRDSSGLETRTRSYPSNMQSTPPLIEGRRPLNYHPAEGSPW